MKRTWKRNQQPPGQEAAPGREPGRPLVTLKHTIQYIDSIYSVVESLDSASLIPMNCKISFSTLTQVYCLSSVRKSPRGRNNSAKDEGEEEKESAATDVPPSTSLDASSSPDKDLTMLSDSQPEIQAQVAAASQAANSAEQEPQRENPENPSQQQCAERGEEEKGGWSREDAKGAES